MKTYLPPVLLFFLFVTCSKDEKPVQYELSTSISPIQSGSISPANGLFNSGAKITLIATPDEGYVFKNWDGDVSTSQNPLQLILDIDKNVIAVFEKSDNDNDGVPEDVDTCPDTPSGENVDENGCSESQKDSDGDGVNNALDECPDTEEGQDVNETGCTTGTSEAGGETVEDADGDGIADDIDQCPETPEGEAVDDEGCSDTQKDSDADGVTDDIDECQETMEGSTVDENGCSDAQKDSDNDGVNDDTDACPETPEGETVDETGCVLDLTTFMPDDDFEQILIDSGFDDVLDDSVLTANIEAITTLLIDGGSYNVENLTGLEAFVSLESLSITTGAGDATFAFNGGNHPNLKTLSFDGAQMKSIEINENSNLETLTGVIRLETLNVQNNNSLTLIDFEDATINAITITGNTQLATYRDFDGALGNLMITNNSALESIILNSREVNGLDFSNNAILEFFGMRVLDDVTYPLDFSTCPNLTNIAVGGNDGRFLSIDVSDNQLLEILSVSDSGLSALDVSNNDLLAELDASTNNPQLTCIKVNQAQLDNIPSDWIIDAQTNYALECPE